MFKNEYTYAMERDQNSSASMIANYQVEDLMEKLKLLSYEKLLLKEMKMKQISKHYFIKSFNPGEQFFMFTSICAWLIRKIGKTFDQPQEFDDPNLVITKIIRILHEMDVPTDFQTNKLIQGAGPICIYVMDCLATQALKLTKFESKKPLLKKEDDPMIDLIENDSEIILEKVEEEQLAIGSDESDDDKNGLFDLNFNDNIKNSKKVFQKEYKMDSLTDSEQWRLELERVLPLLKIVIKTEIRDWRSHLEQMKSLRGNIEMATEETHGQLSKLQSEITFIMEKIDSRERHLNNDLKNFIKQYKHILTEYNQINGLLKENESDKMDKEHDLSKINNELENIKIQMEQRGNSMTDGSPLINIKKAIFRIKEEISEMDVKIGVIKHLLENEMIKQSAQYNEFDSLVMMAH